MSAFSKIQNGAGQNSGIRLKIASDLENSIWRIQDGGWNFQKSR